MQDFATIARPLHHLTDRGQPYVWDDPCAQAFKVLQTALIMAPVLAYPDANQPFILDTDASNVGVGAVLSQQSDNGEHVIAYYSRALNKVEQNYCVTRRKLLAVIAALLHFWAYLHGVRFLVRTDHASLTWLLKNPQEQVVCWLETLQGHDFELRHRPGRQHGNADALLRWPCAAAGCKHCPRQEAQAQLAPTVATLRAINGEASCLPLSPAQVQQEQECDTALIHVRSWLADGKWPEWADVAALDTETRAYHSQWGGLEARDGILYRR
ncbi:hypothetical protein AAFF_G00067460 [Aldrovandia affinis]|uniref:Reverse transcriptase/retrotransposon-derived protein RNase H-like domain-containing protein n=1 Tax=Aldrovandia affinis TaxID=143900 RepID=A0AAD7WZ07_9TELE|nr:hypothetical protein AAFF_G00067460 [Aldrovandia affinis]